jgi:hypothetical protein
LFLKEKAMVSPTNNAIAEALLLVAIPMGNNRNNGAGEQYLIFIFVILCVPHFL